MAVESSLRSAGAHPALIFIAQVLTTSAAVGLTEPNSLLRTASLPVVLYCAAAQIQTLSDCYRPQWASAMCGTSLLLLFQHVDLVHLGGREHQKGTPKAGEENTFLRKLARGVRETTSFRHIGTAEQVKNVPPFSGRDPSHVPSRAAFVLGSFLRTATCFLLIDVTDTFPLDPRESARLFAPDKIPVIARPQNISQEALTLRLVTSVGFILTLFCVAHVTYYPIALAVVGSGLSSPTPWRPLFNSLGDARSVRLFWGRFWHQNMRRPLSRSASFLTEDVLRLRRGSILARYAHLLLVFALSGLLHLLAQAAGGVPLSRAAGAMRFFVTQGLGIMLEDVVGALYTWSVPEESRARSSRLRLFERVVGYVWLVVFMAWSVPVWVYSVASAPPREPFLPFSVIQRLRSFKGE